MKNPFDSDHRGYRLSRGLVLAGLLSPWFSTSLHAEGTTAPPVLQFTSGLPGKQVRLTWPSEPGLRYAIEKSPDLGTAGSSWSRIALVESSGPNAQWVDPEATTTRCFYRVTAPQPEVFSISPPLLSASGGTIIVKGQCFAEGSLLVLEIEGMGSITAPLSSLIVGQWQADFTGSFTPGARVISARIVKDNVTLATVGQQISITETGRALDAPSALPPASPVVPDFVKSIPSLSSIAQQSGPGYDDCDDANPGLALSIPNSAMAIKTKGTGAAHNRMTAGGSSPYDDDSDGVDLALALSIPSNGMAIKTKGTGAAHGRMSAGGSSPYNDDNGDFSLLGVSDDCDDRSDPIMPLGMAINEKGLPGDKAGTSPKTHGRIVPTVVRHAINTKGTGAQGGRIMPYPAGLPGEVAFQTCPIEIISPAGPSLSWVCTYRSKAPVSSGHGPGWDFAYNISVEPIPSTAGSSAPRVLVRDGGGASHTFHRQPNGAYRCDGLFREGAFVGNVFTLTFADTGKWIFNPLDGSPSEGKISSITSRHGVSVACAYGTTGLLSSVSNSFGSSLSVAWSPTGTIESVSDHTGRTVHFVAYAGGETGGSPGDLKSISCPQLAGTPSLSGEITFAYSTGSSDPNLNHNLLSITDAGGRLWEAFTYSSSSSPTDISYDTCSTHDRNHTGTIGAFYLTEMQVLSSGNYLMTEKDEIGRVTETIFDRLHRAITFRQYTGFSAPGVMPISHPAEASRLRSTDPDYFETSCDFNADNLCTRITYPDGSQELITYDRDLRRDCPVRERGNARVVSLRTPGGQIRTVSCDYLPGFGSESARPGGPIKGISVKCGRNPDHSIQGRVAGNRGVLDYLDDDDDCDDIIKPWGTDGKAARKRKQTDKSEPETRWDTDDDCDGDSAMDNSLHGESMLAFFLTRKGYQYYMASSDLSFRTSLTTAHGQKFTCLHNEKGDIMSRSTPIPGRGTVFQYTPDGRCVSMTETNGPDSSFAVSLEYDSASGHLSSLTRDPAGLALTTTCLVDPVGRVIRITDPLSHQWQMTYSPEGLCTEVSAPGVPQPVTIGFAYDAGGFLARCDVAHLDAAGTPVAANPAYSTFHVRDNRCRLIRVAREERPVDGSSTLDPASLGIENFAVCDITYDASGACTALTTPAVCREQATAATTHFEYDERHQLYRCVAGGVGNPDAVTTQYDYNEFGLMTRRSIVVPSGTLSPTTEYEFDGFHRISSVTDPMGNVRSFEYDNQGRVTCSVYGESHDLPGSENNVLLARSTSPAQGDFLPAHNFKIEIDGCRAVNPLYQGSSSAGQNPLAGCFFQVHTQDDTITLDRFTAGSTAPPVTELITIHRSPAGLVSSIVCNGDTRRTYEYDDACRVIRCSDGACSIELVRDARDRVLVCGTTDHFRVSGLPGKTFTTTREIDALGRITKITDGAGNEAITTYDSLGRPLSQTPFQRPSPTPPARPPVHFAYDGSSTAGPFSVQVSCDVGSTGTPQVLSSCLVRCGELRSTTDSYGHTTVHHNDALRRMTSCDFPDGTHHSVAYDSRGFRVLGTFSDGASRQVTCDSAGRVIQSTWSSLPSSVDPVADASYSYDGLHHLVGITQGTATVSRVHDSCGNLLSETVNGQTIYSSFSHRGRVEVTYPDGNRYVEARGSLGELLAITRLASDGSPVLPPVVTFEHAGHRVCATNQGDKVYTLHTYRGDDDVVSDDSFDACIETVIASAPITGSTPPSSILSRTVFQRDAAQSVVSCETEFSSGTVPQPGRLKTFAHDALGRVVTCITSRRETAGGAWIPETNVSYTLDLEGRRLEESRNAAPGFYVQNSKNPPADQQIGQYSSWPGGELLWDDNGNLLSLSRGTASHQFRYDAEGRLTTCTDPVTSLPVFSLTYDPFGRRSSLTVHGAVGTPPATTFFAYDGSTCVQELTDDGSGSFSPSMTFVCARGAILSISTPSAPESFPAGIATASNVLNSRTCTCTPGYFASPGKTPIGVCPDITMVVTSTPVGTSVVERFDCDDACDPIFLDATGLPTSASSSSTGLRWMAPECNWEPSSGIFLCPGGTYCPDLGTDVSSSKQSNATQAQDHNSVRSNKSS